MALTYKEVGRIPITDATALVVSETSEDGRVVGVTINKFITSNNYTGFAGKTALLIPRKEIKKLINLLLRS